MSLAHLRRGDFEPVSSFYAGKRSEAGYKQSAHCEEVGDVCFYMINGKGEDGEKNVERDDTSNKL